MHSEQTERERDLQLRRMLVSTATAAPERPRRRWALAGPIAAFAVAGAFTGAVSAAALNLPDPTTTVTVEAMTDGLVYDDTVLFGTPVLMSGKGDTAVELGATPAGARELVIALHCEDAGTFDILIDGKLDSSTVCSEADAESATSGGRGLHKLSDAAAHTLTVSTSAETGFVLWVSWAASAIPPEPSAEQAAAMADGEVTEAEYRSAYGRYSDCMTAAGYPLEFVDDSGTVIDYSNRAEAVTSGEEGRCYALEFGHVDPAWQAANE